MALSLEKHEPLQRTPSVFNLYPIGLTTFHHQDYIDVFPSTQYTVYVTDEFEMDNK